MVSIIAVTITTTPQSKMLGPFDGRRKRSRCRRCAASHLKCTGTVPCSNCERKGRPCSYAAASTERPIIMLGSGGHTSTASFPLVKHAAAAAAAARQRATGPRASPAMEDERYFYYFDVFASRNNFNGKNHLFTSDVKLLAELQTLPYLLDSAVVGLRESLEKQDEFPQSNRTALLWTTLFLGMFELMSEASGTGWLQHMIHGTAKGLAASGPAICSTPAGARMFQQAKMFELCRTIIFNDRSFLTQPEWLAASQSLWESGSLSKEWRPLDSLIDIMLLCPDLRYRANEFCRAEDENPSPGVPQEARDIAGEGCALRDGLNAWHKMHMGQDEADGGHEVRELKAQHNGAADDECSMLTRLFWAAISIYVSGEFDYEMHHWNRFGLRVPTLDKATVTRHVETILELTEYALEKSSLSPLLFFFPLRIAGTRSAWAPKAQRERVLRLVDAIAERFAVGHAIREGLNGAWLCMGVVDDDDEDEDEAE